MRRFSVLSFVVATAAPALAGAQAVAPDGTAPERLETVNVTASADASAGGLKAPYAGGQVARGGRVGLFGSLDNLSTPFNITSYTSKLIGDQQANSVGDVLQNDPTVRVARGFGNFQQTYLIRGFPVFSDDISYNGLYGLLPRQYLAAEVVERVEVLRGATAFLNGAAPGNSGIGGSVNIAPKRAANEPFADVTVGLESGAQSYVATDISQRFGPDDRVGLRVNGARRDGGTAVDGEHRKLDVVSLGADYRGDRFRVSADFGYQNHRLQRSQPSVTIVAGLAIPDAPKASRNLDQPWAFSNERDTFGTVRAEYDLSPQATVWIAGGTRDGHESDTFANPTVLDASGTTTAYRFDNTRRDSVATGEVGLRVKLNTYGVSHLLVASVVGYALRSNNAYALSSFAGFRGNLYQPVEVPPPANDFFTGGTLASPLVTARTRNESAAVADMLGFLDDRVLVTLGARYQKIASFNYDYNSAALLSDYSKGRLTPVGGVVFKLDPRVSLYANYIEGLAQGDTAPTTYVDAGGATRTVANAGEIFKPYVSRQEEVGAKFDAGSVGATVGVFQSKKPIAALDIASGRFGIGDKQRNRGVELAVFGEPLKGVRLLGGATYLDTDVDGRQAIGAPRTQVNVNVEWDIPYLTGLTVDGRAVHTTTQFADAADTQRVPSWSRFDVGFRYDVDVLDRRVTLRGRVENVTNRSDWVSVGGYPGAGYLVLGQPRTFLVSGTVGF